MKLFDAKPWWQSKTIVAIVVSLIAKLALLGGIELDAAAVTEMALLVLALVADVMGIWGRDQAHRPIRWRGADAAQADARADAARERLHGAPVERLPADGERDPGGYWAGDRGPFGGAD